MHGTSCIFLPYTVWSCMPFFIILLIPISVWQICRPKRMSQSWFRDIRDIWIFSTVMYCVWFRICLLNSTIECMWLSWWWTWSAGGGQQTCSWATCSWTSRSTDHYGNRRSDNAWAGGHFLSPAALVALCMKMGFVWDHWSFELQPCCYTAFLTSSCHIWSCMPFLIILFIPISVWQICRAKRMSQSSFRDIRDIWIFSTVMYCVWFRICLLNSTIECMWLSWWWTWSAGGGQQTCSWATCSWTSRSTDHYGNRRSDNAWAGGHFLSPVALVALCMKMGFVWDHWSFELQPCWCTALLASSCHIWSCMPFFIILLIPISVWQICRPKRMSQSWFRDIRDIWIFSTVMYCVWFRICLLNSTIECMWLSWWWTWSAGGGQQTCSWTSRSTDHYGNRRSDNAWAGGHFLSHVTLVTLCMKMGFVWDHWSFELQPCWCTALLASSCHIWSCMPFFFILLIPVSVWQICRPKRLSQSSFRDITKGSVSFPSSLGFSHFPFGGRTVSLEHFGGWTVPRKWPGGGGTRPEIDVGSSPGCTCKWKHGKKKSRCMKTGGIRRRRRRRRRRRWKRQDESELHKNAEGGLTLVHY